MNSSTNGTRYYAEEFDAPLKIPAFVFVSLAVIGVAAVCLAAMYLGAWMQRQITPEPELRFVTLTPRPALTQWQCTAHERAEYAEACFRRAKSALTKPKE